MPEQIHIDTLRKRISNSGKTIKQFALDGMPSLRREQTIHRWLSGGTIPESVKNWLDTPQDVAELINQDD